MNASNNIDAQIAYMTLIQGDPLNSETGAMLSAVLASLRRLKERDACAARYLWLRDEAYVINGRHVNGQCAYDRQKEPVAMWIKSENGTADEKVDAAIDKSMAQKEPRDV